MKQPVRVGNHRLTERQGLLLEAETDDGGWGIGEIMPLPGVHEETLPVCLAELRGVLPRLFLDLRINALDRELPLFGLFPAAKLLPSVQCGIEELLFSLLRNSHFPAAWKVLTSALLIDDLSGVDPEHWWQNHRGCQVVKLKVGRQQPHDELTKIRALHKVSGGNLRFRLDANARFRHEAAASFWQELDGIPVEYFEDPVASGEDAVEGMPLAVDEVFWQGSLEKIPEADYFIQKPMRVGGLSKVLHLAKQLPSASAQLVLSSCYESDLSLWIYTGLASFLKLEQAMGFGPFCDLAYGIFTPAFDLTRVPEGLPSLDYKRLKEEALFAGG